MPDPDRLAMSERKKRLWIILFAEFVKVANEDPDSIDLFMSEIKEGEW
jgi:hypothetical protein